MKPFSSLILSLVLAVGLGGCTTISQSILPLEERSFRHGFPMGQDAPRLDDAKQIEIASDGSLKFGGNRVSASRFRTIASSLQSDGEVRAGVDIAANTLALDVVRPLSAITDQDALFFIDIEKDSFDLEGLENGSPIPAPRFKGEPGEYELPVVIRYQESGNRCSVSLDDRSLNTAELYEGAFLWLDTIVQREGGAEAILDNPPLLSSIVARVQVDPKAPWRCVVGALYSIKASGWPFLELELDYRE